MTIGWFLILLIGPNLVVGLVDSWIIAGRRVCRCGGRCEDWQPTWEKFKDFVSVAIKVATFIEVGQVFGPGGGRVYWRCPNCGDVRDPEGGLPSEVGSFLAFYNFVIMVVGIVSLWNACTSPSYGG